MSQLSAKEIRLLMPYIRALEELELGKRKPKSFLQSQFVSVCKGDIPARTKYECAYLKWRKTRPFLSIAKQGRAVTIIPKKIRLKKETNHTIKAKRIKHESRGKIALKTIALQVEQRDAIDRGRQIAQRDNTPNRRINEWGNREDWKKDRGSWIKKS